jgi:hypothetical protein
MTHHDHASHHGSKGAHAAPHALVGFTSPREATA